MSRITKIKNNSCHTLKIIGTPIGNSMDLSPRGIEAFEEADYILCEDTRVTRKLSQLRNFRVQKLISFNKFNERRKINSVIDKINSGKNIVLSSEAGMPVISDPGYKLVEACIKNNISIDVVPGPSSIITALVASGLSSSNFYFAGFPSRKKNERLLKLKNLLYLESTIIWFESPKRVIMFLEDLVTIFGNRKAVICRELTKVFQEVLRDDLCSLISKLKSRKIVKGEFVVLLKGFTQSPKKVISEDVKEEIKKLLKLNTLKSVVEKISNKNDLPKKVIYHEALKIKDGK